MFKHPRSPVNEEKMTEIDTQEILAEFEAVFKRNIRLPTISLMGYAIQEGRIDVVRILLDKGFGVNDKCAYDNRALFFAAQMLQPEIVELLLARGADVNLPNGMTESRQEGTTFIPGIGTIQLRGNFFDGRTPLSGACYPDAAYSERREGAEDRQLRVLKILLSHGAKVNHLDDDGETALHTAVAFPDNMAKVSDLLIKHGINISIKNNEGNTALKELRNPNPQGILYRFIKEQGLVTEDAQQLLATVTIQKFYRGYRVRKALGGEIAEHKAGEAILPAARRHEAQGDRLAEIAVKTTDELLAEADEVLWKIRNGFSL